MAKATPIDADDWPVLHMVACTLPVVGTLIWGGPGLVVGCVVWLILGLMPRVDRPPKRDPLTDPQYGDIREGYVYVGDETWEPLTQMPGLWWQFRASPKEYNAALRVIREHRLDD